MIKNHRLSPFPSYCHYSGAMLLEKHPDYFWEQQLFCYCYQTCFCAFSHYHVCIKICSGGKQCLFSTSEAVADGVLTTDCPTPFPVLVWGAPQFFFVSNVSSKGLQVQKSCTRQIPRQLQKARVIFLRDLLIHTAMLGSTLDTECQPALPTLVVAQARGSKPQPREGGKAAWAPVWKTISCEPMPSSSLTLSNH